MKYRVRRQDWYILEACCISEGSVSNDTFLLCLLWQTAYKRSSTNCIDLLRYLETICLHQPHWEHKLAVCCAQVFCGNQAVTAS